MKSIGAVFRNEEMVFVHLYTDVPGYRHAFPDPKIDQFGYVGHAFYKKGYGGQKRRIDIYMSGKNMPLELIEIKRDVNFSETKKTSEEYDLQKALFYFLTPRLPAKIGEQIKKNVRLDVLLYCDDDSRANIKPDDNLDCFCDTPPWGGKEAKVVGGKAAFNKLCQTGRYNIDWTLSCISHLIPPTDYYPHLSWSPSQQCAYCYAAKNNWTPLRIREFDEASLESKIVDNGIKTIRLGKISDAGHKFFYEHNMQLLQLAEKLNFRVLLVTKFLEFDENLARMLKKTGSAIQYSLGYDDMEPGAVAWGCTNESRIENAIKYNRAGVNAIARLVREAPIAPDNFTLNVLKLFEKFGIPTLFTPLRIHGRAVAKDRGKSWSIIKMDHRQLNFFGQPPDQGTYIQREANTAHPRIFHQDYEDKIEDNNSSSFRVCGHVGDDIFCGGCFMGNGTSGDEKSVKITVEYTNKIEKRKKGNRKQKKLF